MSDAKYSEYKAVDGRNESAPETCNCCFSAENETNQWLYLDLGEQYNLDYIYIRGRTDSKLRYFKHD